MGRIQSRLKGICGCQRHALCSTVIMNRLTIGLMGLDPLHLQVLASSADDPAEKANAKKVLKLMRRGKHWVLVVRICSEAQYILHLADGLMLL